MMKSNKSNFICLLLGHKSLWVFVILFFCSCKKENTEQDTDANTSNQYVYNEVNTNINGVLWENFMPFPQPKVLASHYPSQFFQFSAFKQNNPIGAEELFMRIRLVNDTGYYPRSEIIEAKYIDGTGNQIWDINNGGDGWFRVTEFDLNNQIISGEFEFTAINQSVSDTVSVEQGRIQRVHFMRMN